MQFFDDDRIRDELSAADAVLWMREAAQLHQAGRLLAPPRLSADLGDGRIILTAGRSHGEFYGFRSYDTLSGAASQQVVVTHDDATGDVLALAVGNELGPRRTGALGAVACHALSAPSAPLTIALIGAGRQAWTQLWGISAALLVAEVRVHSRSSSSRGAFAARARAELRLPTRPCDSAEQAVRGADIVVLATTSATSVLECRWLAGDVVVVTVGPKQIGRAEFPRDLLSRADQLVTDSHAQLAAYDPPALATTLDAAPVVELGAVVAGAAAASTSGRRIFLSVGLAGTEVHLLGRLAQRVIRDPEATPVPGPRPASPGRSTNPRSPTAW